MNPTDPVEAFAWMATLLGVFGLPLLLILAAAEWLVQKTTTRKAEKRESNRIPPEELALLGEDWRDSVAHLFHANQQGGRTR